MGVGPDVLQGLIVNTDNYPIYKLVQKKMVVWLIGPDVSKPNGLYAEKSKLILGNSGDGTLKAINLVTKSIGIIAKIGFGINGSQSDWKGNYFISD